MTGWNIVKVCGFSVDAVKLQVQGYTVPDSFEAEWLPRDSLGHFWCVEFDGRRVRRGFPLTGEQVETMGFESED